MEEEKNKFWEITSSLGYLNQVVSLMPPPILWKKEEIYLQITVKASLFKGIYEGFLVRCTSLQMSVYPHRT